MRFSTASVALLAGVVAAIPQASIQPISQISDGQIQAPPATSVVPAPSEVPSVVPTFVPIVSSVVADHSCPQSFPRSSSPLRHPSPRLHWSCPLSLASTPPPPSLARALLLARLVRLRLRAVLRPALLHQSLLVALRLATSSLSAALSSPLPLPSSHRRSSHSLARHGIDLLDIPVSLSIATKPYHDRCI
ncbi:hypothetical protein IQ07DRAFT_182418 [Pyrenochaeta sp. DS3sAY3a]|nr:hypothetical protein IQ07DRAFT_182418 [Pyrenochaeta sp. DS3sAY3a]